MTSQPSAAVAAAIAESKNTQDEDALARLQAEARKARDLEFTINSLNEQLKEAKENLHRIYSDTLVRMMDEAGLDHIGLAPEGNYPGKDYHLKNSISANIAAGWTNDKREAGFDYLRKMKAEDIIKTEVVVYFPGGGLEQAKKLLKQVQKLKIVKKIGKKKIATPVRAELSKAVPHGTLGAWLRELVEKHKIVPPPDDLEKIGGYIGRIVKVEERKE